MNKKIVVTNINEMLPKFKDEHDGYQYNKYEVTKRKDFSQAYVCFYEIMPGIAAFPKHYHSYNTECFYIIEGTGVVLTNEEEIKIKRDDIIVFPCGKASIHKIVNTSKKENLLYIDFDATNSPDIVHYTDSNKIGIIEHNIASTFYFQNDDVNYYDGE